MPTPILHAVPTSGDPEDTLELSPGLTGGASAASAGHGAAPASGPRPYLRLWFACANQYARAYRSPCGTAYTGRCPTCGKGVRFVIGANGTSERFFRVSCR